MENKGITIGLGLFCLITIGDLISTLVVGRELIEYLETNLLYKYIGLTGIMLLQVGLIAFVYFYYTKRAKVGGRFAFLNLISTVGLTKLIVITNNIQIAMNPPTLIVAQQVTTAAKTAAYANIVWMNFLPLLAGLVAFYLFRMDHKVEKNERSNLLSG